MLKYRIFSAVLMTVLFGGLVILDGWLDGSITAAPTDDKPIQGTLLAILVAVVMALAVLEFANLSSSKGLRVLVAPTIVAVVALATAWYWPQWLALSLHSWLLLALVFERRMI